MPVIRCALVVAERRVPSWQRRVVAELMSVDGVEVCLVVVAPESMSSARHQRSFGRAVLGVGAAFGREDLPDGLAGCTTVELPANTPDGWRSEPVRRAFVSAGADLVLQLGGRPPGSDPGPTLPHGWWSLRHGRPVEPPDRPCAAEIVDRDPVTVVSLVRRTNAGEVELAAAHVATIPHSYRRQRDHAALATAQLPAMVCARLVEDPGWEGGAGPDRRTSPAARHVGTLRLAAQLARNWFARQWDGLARADRWHVGIAHRPISTFLEQPTTDDVQWLPRPNGRDRYVADPFGHVTSGDSVVLVEDYDHRSRHGRISAYRLPDGDEASGPISVATLGTHASYPFLVEVDGELWCIPETAAARQVRAHRFDATTLSLDDLGPLIDGVALSDPTMFRWQGRWWLLGTDFENGPNSHLRGWWAEDPRGPWQRHPIDPLLIDVRGGRGAGTPFVAGGRLYRPAQDCSHGYGSAVVIKRVDRLDPQGFVEQAVARVAPPTGGPFRDGCHTLSELGDRTLVDAVGRRFSAAALRHELRARLAPRH